jgi:alanine dehydrogenase
VGTNAAKIALGLGADVTILDVNPKRLAELEDLFDGFFNCIFNIKWIRHYCINTTVKQIF